MDDKDLMTTVDKAKKLLTTEIDKIVATGSLTKESLCLMKEALEAVEMVKHIERGEEPDGYSQRNYFIRDWDYPMMGGNSYADPMGNSYARGRSSITGRYVSRDNGMGNSYGNGMSYTGGDREYMMQSLETAMKEAGSEQDRMMIRNLMNQMKNSHM